MTPTIVNRSRVRVYAPRAGCRWNIFGPDMGRFGGGWDWKLGVQAGRRRRDGWRTIMVSLLVREYRVEVRA